MAKLARIILLVLAGLLAIVLVGPFLVPVPPLQGTMPPEQLADPDSRFVEINGLSVHCKTAGSGDPDILLLHGFGASVFSWREVLQPLGRYGTVIAYDRPAFGLTERPLAWTGADPYGLEGNEDLLLGLLDHFQIRQAVLVGNSAGGTLAMAFALAHPERVRALVLVDAAVHTGGGVPDWIRPLLRTPQMSRLGPLLAREIESSGPQLLRQAWHDPSRITPEILAGYSKPLRAEHWDVALWNFTAAGRDAGLARRLKEFTMPVWVLTGDDDRIVPTAQSVRLAGGIPGAILITIRNSGHVPQEEQPAAFLEAMNGILRSLI